MIKPSDISVTVEPADKYPQQKIRAGINLGVERITMGDGSTEVEREQDRCREEIWHALYGDIAKELDAVERAVYPILTFGGYDSAKKAFGKLRAVLMFDREAEKAEAHS